MSTPLGSMHIELGLDTSKFASNLNASKRAVQYFSTEARALDGVLKNSGNSLTVLSAKHKSLNQAFEKQKDVLKALKDNFDKLEPGSKKWENAAIEIERNKSKLEGLRGQLNQVEDAMKKVHAENSKWGKLGTQFQQFGDRATHFGSKLRDMGNAMAPVSTLLSAGFTLATRKALDFEGQMQTTKALLSDTVGTAGELNAATKQLGDASKQWAKKYGISTSEINTGMQEVIKAGLGVNQTMGAMPAILTASKATGEDFNTVMGATTSIMSQFGLITNNTNQMLKNTNRVTDSLSFVANKTKAGFADMGLAMEYVGPVANSVGMDIEETAAAIGILSNAGIDGQKAGTALRGALSKLLDPSKENAKAFAQLGFSAEEFRSGAIKLPDVIERIKKNTDGMTDAQKAALIAQAFGIEAQSGINALVNEGADALRGLTNETKNADGYTDTLYKKMSGSGKASVERFKSAIEVLQVTIGQKLLPILTPIVEKVTEWVEKFAEADEGTQKFVIGLAGFLAVGYPALNFLGNFSTGLGFVSRGIGKLMAKKAAAATITSIGTAASGAASSTGLFSAAAATLGGLPIWGILAGTAVVAGLGYFAIKAGEAEARTREWGTAVDETEAKALSKFKRKVDESNQAMLEFGSGAGNVKKVKETFDDLANSVNKLADKKLAKQIDLAEKLGLSDTVINALKSRSQQVIDNVNGMNDQVKAIYERHKGDMSQLTQVEKELVLRNQNEMIQAQLELMNFSAKEKKALTAALNGELDQLNKSQLDKALKNTNEMLEKENKAYKTRKSELKEVLANFGKDTSKLSQEELASYREIKSDLNALESEHLLKKKAYNEQWLNIQRERVKKLHEAGKDEQMVQYELAAITQQLAKEMGISYKEASKLLSQSVDTSSEKLGILSNQTAKATKEVAAANAQWDSLFTSKNPQQSLNDLLSTADGWNRFEIMVKNADVNPAGRHALAEMLVSGGQWQNMTLDQKKLVVDGQKAMVDIFDSKKLLEEWQALTPKQKQLLAENLTEKPAMSAREALNSVKQAKPATITAEDKTGVARDSANASVNSPKQNSPIAILGKDNTGSEVAKANQAVNSPRQRVPAQINAINNASGAAKQAAWDLNSIPRAITSTITTFVKKIFKNEHGTDFHPGGLAMVNDQKGPLYKELVTLPTGESFIPEGRDVILPLPRGSKVMTASRTKAFMARAGIPRYAQGVGYSVNSPFIQSLERAEQQLSQQVTVQQDNSDVVALLRAILAQLKQPNLDRVTIDVTGELGYGPLDYRGIAEVVSQLIAQELQRKSQLRGVNP